METKVCSKCKEEKELLEFSRLNRHCYRKVCDSCRKITSKICSLCKEEKELSNFGKHTKGYYRSVCNPCRGIQAKEYSKSGKQKKSRDKRNIKRVRDDTCCLCINQKTAFSRYCLFHWVQRLVKKNMNEKNNDELVQNLLDKFNLNEGTCFYSGVKILPGLTASIDHRIPKSKGGTNDITNLEWVHMGINTLKGNFTEKEFISKCAPILVNFNYEASKQGVI